MRNSSDHYHIVENINDKRHSDVQGTRVFYSYEEMKAVYEGRSRTTANLAYRSCYDLRCARYFDLFQEYEIAGWRSYLASKGNQVMSEEVAGSLVRWQSSRKDTGTTFTEWAKANIEQHEITEWRIHMFKSRMSFEEYVLSLDEHYFNTTENGFICACSAKQIYDVVGVDIGGIWSPLEDAYQHGCLGEDPLDLELELHRASLASASTAFSKFMRENVLNGMPGNNAAKIQKPFYGMELVDNHSPPSVGSSVYLLRQSEDERPEREFMALTQIGREEDYISDRIDNPISSLVHMLGTQMIAVSADCSEIEIDWLEGHQNVLLVKVTDVSWPNRSISYNVGLAVMPGPRNLI